MPPRPAIFAGGAPNGLAGPPGTTGGVAPSPLAPGNAEATWLNAGAAEVQPWGTDNAPSEAARPAVAVTAVPPMPGELTAPAPELAPVLSADPNTWNPLPKALVADPIEFMSEPAEPSIEMPEVAIEADEAVPDTRLVPDVSAVDDDVRVVKDDSGDVDDEDNVAGIAAEVRGVDSAEVSGDTVCAPVPAEVPAACVDRSGQPAHPGWVGGLQRSRERCQRRCSRRRTGIAVHRRGILRPHLDVLGLGGHDRRGVLTEEVRRDQHQQQSAVGRNHRRRHRHSERCLVGGHGRRGLSGSLLQPARRWRLSTTRRGRLRPPSMPMTDRATTT